YLALTRENLGRRINRVDVDSSLVLLKATGQISHGGGKRFDKSSWAYRLLREWIEQGAPWRKGSGAIQSPAVTPSEAMFSGPDGSARLRVTAAFAKDATEDITYLCDFRSNDEAIVQVSPGGELKALRPGDTAVIVSYRGHVVPVRVLVPAARDRGF